MYFVKTPSILKKMLPNIVFNIPNENNNIFLTFDDGPHPNITPWLLDFLNERKIKATFFCVGENVAKYPAIYNRIINENHTVANHTMTHISGWRTATTKYLADIASCDEYINSKLFRPPYGRVTLSQIKQIQRNKKIILWDIMPGDFDEKISNSKCVDRIVKNVKSGSIIVLHDSEQTMQRLKEILPIVVDVLHQKAYNFAQI